MIVKKINVLSCDFDFRKSVHEKDHEEIIINDFYYSFRKYQDNSSLWLIQKRSFHDEKINLNQFVEFLISYIEIIQKYNILIYIVTFLEMIEI